MALLSLVALDVVAGGLLLFWPGVWQELLHPAAMGTTFYPLQRLGAAWVARGCLTGVAAARGSALLVAAVAGAWMVEVPADLLVGWRTAGTGPWTGWFYAGRAVLAAAVAVGLWRVAQTKVRGE